MTYRISSAATAPAVQRASSSAILARKGVSTCGCNLEAEVSVLVGHLPCERFSLEGVSDRPVL